MPGLETRVLMQPPDAGVNQDVPQVVLANEWQDINADTRTRQLTSIQEAMVNTRFNDNDAVTSQTIDVSGVSAAWVGLFIESTGTPTDIRIVPLLGFGGTPPRMYDFVEGLWASMMYEDTDTANGILHTYLLPCAGALWLQFRVVATGASAVNYFEVRITVQPFRGNFATAHS